MPGGSLLDKSLWCNKCKETCPVHALLKFWKPLDVGLQGFAGIFLGFALYSLRELVIKLEVPDAVAYHPHDLRRGHAQDVLTGGARQ